MGKITTAFTETVSTHHLKTSETRPQNCTNITQNPTRMKRWFCKNYHLSSGMRRCQKCKISQNQRIENDWIWRSKLIGEPNRWKYCVLFTKIEGGEISVWVHQLADKVSGFCLKSVHWKSQELILLSSVTPNWRVSINVRIVVLNCQKCDQCLKGHKSPGLLFQGVLSMSLSFSSCDKN